MKIVFPIDVYQKLRAYVESVRVEISGLGRISIKDQTIRVEEVKIFRQICMAGGTILDKRDIGDFWDTLDDPSGWKLWWHSHGELKAYFSPTDDATIAEFDNQTKEDNWQLSLVTNRSSELEARLDFFSPFPYTIEKIEWEIDFVPRVLEDEVFDEVMQKVQIYQEKISKDKKENTNYWGNEEEELPLLPPGTASESGILLPTQYDFNGRRVEIDPKDLKRHPEFFGIRGNGKRK